MKITLNSSIPEERRPEIEALVGKRFFKPTIIWLPSRFPRYVMLVEPGKDGDSEPLPDSIFDSPEESTESPAKLAEMLEEQIKERLSPAK
ncbi:hypothetical protein ACFQY0_10130 [Haloferula chungangensis]|uniref:Uncharacterized protein n=1 Tax=Haloferula chungangensis TaxID=1048331 RepID=A0ABW2L8C8_9BACT